jgi:hypothetical protein
MKWEDEFFKLIGGWFSKAPLSNFSHKQSQKELQAFYLSSKQRYEDDVVIHDMYDFALDIVGYVKGNYFPNKDFPSYLIELLLDVTVLAIKEENLFDFPYVNFKNEIPLSEQIYIKKEIELLNQRVYDNKGVKRFYNNLIYFLKHYLLSIENSLGNDKDGNIFESNMIHFTHDLNYHVGEMVMAFFLGEVHELGLFHNIRHQLLENMDVASGLGYKRTYQERYKGDKATSAHESKLQGEALVKAYLQHTYIENMFEGDIPFTLPLPLRFEHCHILAGTGHGKTQLIQKLILDDLDVGRGCMIIDSQGDMIEKISHLDIFNPSQKNSLSDKLIIINPEDVNFPVALNMFALNVEREKLSELDRQMLINSAVDLYEYMFGALFGAELTSRQGVIFKYVAKLMVEIPNATIHTLRQLLENGKAFEKYMNRLEGSAKDFFTTQFFSTSFVSTKKQILSRLWAVLSNQTLENLFSSDTNKVDIFEAMNEGKIVLVNTSKQLLQSEGSQILGRFFIALLSQATIKRATIAENQRKPFMVYIDEAHEYIDEKIEHMLNQSRKYKVGFTLSHQNLHQLGGLKNTVFSSTSIKLAGGISAKDATDLSYEMKSTKDFLLDMRKSESGSEFACYLKNHKEKAIPLTFDFGLLENRGRLSTKDYDSLINSIREKYCQSKESLSFGNAIENEVVEKVEEKKPTLKVKPVVEKKEPQPVQEIQVKKVEKIQPVALVEPKIVTVKNEGKGGATHTYLQKLVKKIGQEKNFHSIIEEEVFEGLGSVDVGLSGFGKKIAVEISVSTSSKWESSNIAKCLSASFDYVIILSDDTKHLAKLESDLTSEFTLQVKEKKLLFLTSNTLITFLNEVRAKGVQKEKTVLGYKVKVNFAPLDKKESDVREEAIAKAMLKG